MTAVGFPELHNLCDPAARLWPYCVKIPSLDNITEKHTLDEIEELLFSEDFQCLVV